jgi:hypothetical protein
MSIGAKSSLGKLTGTGGIVRKADKDKTAQNTKKAEGNLKAKSKVTQN